MLERPELADAKLVSCLQDEYGTRAIHIDFLPLGADVNTAVYRVVADDGRTYFLKLRRGALDETAVTIPRFLRDQGIEQIIGPMETTAGRLWTRVDGFTVILYPFIAGRDAYEAGLSERQWFDLGLALKRIHSTVVPHALGRRVPQETYTPRWRDRLRAFQVRAEDTAFGDPIAAELAAFLRSKRDLVADLVWRAERLAKALRNRSLEHVLCHADIHARNVLIGANDALYIVDWDTLVFAPKEHDLMMIGQLTYWRDPASEALFYRGYGQTERDGMAIAYYRYERIVQDMAEFCAQLLLTDKGGEDRKRTLHKLVTSFLPGRSIDFAYQSDAVLGPSGLQL